MELDAKLGQIIDILVDCPSVSDENIGLALGLSADEVANLIEEHDLEAVADEEYERQQELSGIDESMDGDAASALASAGFGTDEDYGYIAENDYYD